MAIALLFVLHPRQTAAVLVVILLAAVLVAWAMGVGRHQ